jgi:hypothetical protein
VSGARRLLPARAARASAALALAALAALAACALAAVGEAWLGALRPRARADGDERALAELWRALALAAVPIAVGWPGLAACAAASQRLAWRCAACAAERCGGAPREERSDAQRGV